MRKNAWSRGARGGHVLTPISRILGLPVGPSSPRSGFACIVFVCTHLGGVVIWGGKAHLYRAKERPGTRRDSGARELAPNASDSVQTLAFDLPGSRRSALTCGGLVSMYLSADF